MDGSARIHVWRHGQQTPERKPSEIEEAAVQTVATAVATSPRQAHTARALIRLAGNVLARLGGHEEAFRHHAERARYHYERMGKTRR